jgi:hemoglobin
MKLTITDGKIGVRPPVTKPHPGFLHEVGKERFHKLVYDHYKLIETSEIAFLFPVLDEEDFEEAKHHAFIFLYEISGGEPLFTQERGEHQMVGRHAPFRIDEKGRRVWLELYAQLLEPLEEEGINPEYIQSFWDYLDIFSMWLVNTED